MTLDIAQAPLLRYLRLNSSNYCGKLFELRSTVEGWLAYTTETFPHYTRHTVGHSDEIISQLSKLLFYDDDPGKPVLSLSPVETYIVAASAFLHDAGMVVSDDEKHHALESEDWTRWLESDATAAQRLSEIETLRKASTPSEPYVRNFLADRQLRFLLAEFFRRTHHRRTALLLTQHQRELGRFAYDDTMLLQAISNVCLAHGLARAELEDDQRFPSQCDIRGDKANIKLLAILLRLGDLLDISNDRACPLIMSAASPLPPSSIAHWTQYQQVINRETSPERIRIIAECETQEQHRQLQDWSEWIVDELSFASNLASRWSRHGSWQPPYAALDEVTSISIRPSENATYVPSKWRLELDSDAVLQRLIHNVGPSPLRLVRELLQNAIDATRCRLYVDLGAAGLITPISPTEVSQDWRARYPVCVVLQRRRIFNELLHEFEECDELVIEDNGIGMDSDIIERFFLQIGRSYYTTDEFHKRFPFVPTSRFGIGFLTVFAASSHVVVETLRSDGPVLEPLRLTLNGPRTYLLTEKGSRTTPGTRIEIRLREPLENDRLTSFLQNFCRRVEFPIEVTEYENHTTIEAETAQDFEYEEPDPSHKGGVVGVRAFPIQRKGIEGEVYVFYRRDEHARESWGHLQFIRGYATSHPTSAEFKMPEPLSCVNGLLFRGMFQGMAGRIGPDYAISARIDYRKPIDDLPLSREPGLLPKHELGMIDPEITTAIGEILAEHLAETELTKGPKGWLYKQRLMNGSPFSAFWLNQPESLEVFIDGKRKLVSLSEAECCPIITIAIPPERWTTQLGNPAKNASRRKPTWDSDNPSLIAQTISTLSDLAQQVLFKHRYAQRVRWLRSGQLAVDWARVSDTPARTFSGSGCSAHAVDLLNDKTFAFRIHRTINRVYDHALLNTRHPLTQWLLRVQIACHAREAGLTPHQWRNLWERIRIPVWHDGYQWEALIDFLDEWRLLPDLPRELAPPEVELSAGLFIRTRKPPPPTEYVLVVGDD